MEYRIVLPFNKDDDPKFTLGVEVGLAHGHLWSSPDEMSITMHVENAEMALRLAESTGRQLQTEELGNGWLRCNFSESNRLI